MKHAPAKQRRQTPPTASPEPPQNAGLNGALAATTLVSAWLLFQVQPMVAKRILPWFGGGTAVWTTTMLFFQTALFAGYAYAHLATRLLRPARQVFLHVALLAAAVALVAVASVVPGDVWKPDSPNQPALRILGMLAGCVGLPYLMLSATAPLVQVWFARANPGRTPYRLYALSNFGSLAALVTYPLAVEPNLGVARQGVVWSVLFAAFALMCAVSGFQSLRVAAPREAEPDSADQEPDDGRSPWLTTFFWIALPACASVVLLSVTTYICQDVASIPLLWIAPMVVYLVSFILTFESSRWYSRRVWLPAMSFLALGVASSWHYGNSMSYPVQVALNLALLLALTMVCHGELAAMRPPPRRLTAYFLCIAGGGAIGGFLAGIVAPLVLADYYELPMGILAAWALAVAVLVTDRQSAFYDGRSFLRLAAWVVLGLATAVTMGMFVYNKRTYLVDMTRNFYGVLRVRKPPVNAPEFEYHQLTNGHISHGVQFRTPEIRRVPTQYYHPNSGIGLLLASPHDKPRRIGIVGLGIGTLAAYAEADEEFVFYEINPRDVDFADEHFTLLADARERGARVTIELGDARLSLERQPPQNFDLLAVDAFTSDSIPAHLLTLEAVDLYLKHLQPNGILALHVSNRYLNLAVVALAAAEHFGLDAVMVDAPAGERDPIGTRSRWVLMHREQGFFARVNLGVPLAEATAGRPSVAWTDDFNNVLEVLTYGTP